MSFLDAIGLGKNGPGGKASAVKKKIDARAIAAEVEKVTRGLVLDEIAPDRVPTPAERARAQRYARAAADAVLRVR